MKGQTYSVDVDNYTCDCESYPLVSYCKHLAAVQIHFFEDFDVQNMVMPTTKELQSQSTEFIISALASDRSPVPDDLSILISIAEKMRRLTVCT